jgi:hypothetical protein
VEILIFSFTVAIYLVIIFKYCDTDRWGRDRRARNDKHDLLDILFYKIRRIPYIRKLHFNTIVLCMAAFIVAEACVLIKVNFIRVENQRPSYHIDAVETDVKY